MLCGILILLILVLTGALTVAAIVFRPETLYFPDVEFSIPDKFVIQILQRGHLDKESCAKSIGMLRGIIRVKCPECRYVGRYARGLDDERTKAISREPIGIPSARIAGE